MRRSIAVTPCGAVHVVEPEVVNCSTTYFVPVVVPEIVLLLPVKPARPVDEMVNDSDTDDAALYVASPL